MVDLFSISCIKIFIRQGEILRKYNVNHDFFESINTEERAYWLGFISADGCISERYNYKNNKPYVF